MATPAGKIVSVDDFGRKKFPSVTGMIDFEIEGEVHRCYRTGHDSDGINKLYFLRKDPVSGQYQHWKTVRQKRVTILRKVHKSVQGRAERMARHKFGKAANARQNKQTSSLSDKEFFIEKPRSIQDDIDDSRNMEMASPKTCVGQVPRRGLRSDKTPPPSGPRAYVPRMKRNLSSAGEQESVEQTEGSKDNNNPGTSGLIRAYQPPGRRNRGSGGRDGDRPRCTVRVNNLPGDVTQDDLYGLFQNCGEVRNVKLIRRDREDADSDVMYAFVDFRRVEDPKRAISQYHGKPVSHWGVILQVELAKPRKRLSR